MGRGIAVLAAGAAVLIAGLGAAGSTGAAAATGDGSGLAQVGREALTLNFGDFQSKAELDYPIGRPHAPVVVLIPGSGPEDMNADITGASGATSHIFLDIAGYLAPRGFAVLRYDKHYVQGPGQVDPRFFTKLDLEQMLTDAGTVLAAAEGDAHVDPHRVFVYGWSEGSTVAAALVRAHPEVSGVAFQGPVTESWRDLFTYQFLDVSLPYLRRYAPDGTLTAASLQAAYQGPGGLVAKELVFFLAANPTAGDFTVRAFWDPDHDGAISIATDFLPTLPQFFDLAFSAQGFWNIYAPGRALPDVVEQAPFLKRPVLILQGANDANVPAEGARDLDQALARAHDRDHALVHLPGLGHSLGPASSVATDDFRPIARPPLAALRRWLARQSR